EPHLFELLRNRTTYPLRRVDHVLELVCNRAASSLTHAYRRANIAVDASGGIGGEHIEQLRQVALRASTLIGWKVRVEQVTGPEESADKTSRIAGWSELVDLRRIENDD